MTNSLERKVLIEKHVYFWGFSIKNGLILMLRNCMKFDEKIFDFDLSEHYFCSVSLDSYRDGFVTLKNTIERCEISEKGKKQYLAGKHIYVLNTHNN